MRRAGWPRCPRSRGCCSRWRAGSAPHAALSVALAVGFHAQAARLAEARAASAGEPREGVVEGVVVRRSAALAPRWIELGSVRGAGIARVRVFSAQPGDLDAWLPGDRVRARLRLAPLRFARVPGDGDPLRRLWRAGIAVGGSLPLSLARGRARRNRAARAAAPDPREDRGGARGERRRWCRTAARPRAGRCGSARPRAPRGVPPARARARALGVGAPSRVGQRRALRDSAARRCGARPGPAARWDTRRLALAPACAAALLYAALAGWSVPVRRSLLVVLAAGSALAHRRPQLAGASLAAAALWILAEEPDALFQTGAQLSFGAMAAFVWTLRRPARERRIAAALRTSATAIAATAPIVAWHGGGVSSASVAANAIALPWLECAVVSAALVAAVAGRPSCRSRTP